MSKKIDVVVVGAGFVGLWASIALSRHGLSVTLVDSKTWEIIESYVPNNIFALTDYVYTALLEHGISVKACPVESMQIGTVKHFPALSLGESCQVRPIAWTVSALDLWKALVAKIKEENIICRTEFSVSRCLLSHDSVQLIDKHGSSIDAELVLAADGSHSWLRNYFNIPCIHKNQILPAKTAVFPINWKDQDPITARQWFGDKFGVIAFLPYAGTSYSACCVWSLPAKHYLWNDDNPSWGEALCGFLGIDSSALTVAGDIYCYDIEEYITPVVGQRCVLLGNAAYSVHPLAGQGLNIGFRGVLHLSGVLGNRPSFRPVFDASILRAYGRKSEIEARKWSFVTRSLWYASSNSISLEILLRGLLLTDQFVFAKNWFVRCAQ
ncbi:MULTISPECIES: FAD-dependent oxidoreductase [Candidatus Ichthyocystis]|uniref:FAD-dependent oxidoreductase n=1 Tax=Candidatus Ichthyocystis TaxID=2929841 RepID=UPI000B87DE1B|nr:MULTISPECIES: FAD-dependent oxidoreductase [Ichthyocystis]